MVAESEEVIIICGIPDAIEIIVNPATEYDWEAVSAFAELAEKYFLKQVNGIIMTFALTLLLIITYMNYLPTEGLDRIRGTKGEPQAHRVLHCHTDCERCPHIQSAGPRAVPCHTRSPEIR